MPKIEKYLQEAILRMPEKEKNKLLIRLVSKDKLLTAQLEHGLLGDENDMIDRRNELMEEIKNMAKDHDFYNIIYLLSAMRLQNSAITYHYKVTKDKFGEVQLTASLINFFFKYNLETLHNSRYDAEQFAVYVVKKAISVLSKVQKLHEDYHTELELDINDMLDYIHNYGPCDIFAKIFALPRRFN